MKTKNKIEEKKLSKAELEAREKVMKDLKKNKSALVKRYGKDAEAVMYGRATNIAKKMAEAENKNKIKEMVRKTLMQEADIEVDADKYEGEKELGQVSMMMDELESLLKGFDWYYYMSDDPRVYRNGSAYDNKVSNLVKQLTDLGYGDDAKKLYAQYAPERMSEGKKEDVDKDGDIDSKDYLAKRDAAIKKAKGEMKEDIDLGHEDNEPHMIKSDLYRIGKYAMELYAMAEELEETGQEIDFPSWWQAMITDAATKMVKAKHYLDFELKEPAIDAFVDKLTGEKPHMGEPKPPMVGDLDEGFLDRMKAGVKGAVAGVGQAAKNVGAAVKGDASQFKNVANTANMAKLGQKVKTFEKEINDVINDINKLFPKEKLDKDPNFKATIDKYMSVLNQAKTLNSTITKTPSQTSTPTSTNNNQEGPKYVGNTPPTKKKTTGVAEKLAKKLKETT